jgi:hypothetical protein
VQRGSRKSKKTPEPLGFHREQRVHVDVAQRRNLTMHTNTPITEREQALRWLVAHRRPDISLEQALCILRAALPHDEETVRLLQRMSEEGTPD